MADSPDFSEASSRTKQKPAPARESFRELREDLLAEVRNHARLSDPGHPWAGWDDETLLEKTGLLEPDSGTGIRSVSPAGTLLFGTESSIARLFPDLRSLLVERDRPDGKRVERVLPRNLIDAFRLLLENVESRLPEADHASFRRPSLQIIFGDFIKKRDYSHATPAKLTLNPEHFSLEFYRYLPGPESSDAAAALHASLTTFWNALHPETAEEIDSTESRNTMQAYFGSIPVILHGKMFKILALKPKKRVEASVESTPAPQPVSPAPTTVPVDTLPQTDLGKLAWPSETTPVRPQSAMLQRLEASMQASPTKAFRTSRTETAKIDWNSPRPAQTSRTARILEYCASPRNREEIQQHVGMNNRDHFRKEVLNPLIEKGLLRPTIPDKPNSPKQQYVRV